MITTEDIKKLRDATGVSVMQCKKALEEAKGDMDKALIILRKKSADIAAKKADRESHSGTVASYIHSNGRVGAMVILSSETDFVSNNEDFRKIAHDIAMHITAANPEYLKKEDVPAADIEKAKEVFASEVKDKPKNIQEKILEGKLASYFGEKTLLDQPFIKNPELTIRDLLQTGVQKFGEKIEVVKFSRFSI
jgi:elongation factor Ts